jgi:hypothetical protein
MFDKKQIIYFEIENQNRSQLHSSNRCLVGLGGFRLGGGKGVSGASREQPLWAASDVP